MPLTGPTSRQLLVAAVLTGTAAAHGQSADEKAIHDLLHREVVAEMAGDTKAYMATIDPKSPSFARTSQIMAKVLHTFKLRVTLDAVKIVSIKGNTATVDTTISTYKVSGTPAFQNNRIDMSSELIKRDGKWYVSGGKFKNLTKLK